MEPFESGPAIHVLLRKEELDPERLADKTVVVVDVLFATTSIVTALDRGIASVHPARDADEARALAQSLAQSSTESPGGAEPVLSGEAMFQFIDGFAPPTPMALAAHLDGRDALVYTTTNGTVALRAAAPARRVLVGALVNAAATAAAVDVTAPGTILIMCAGTAGAFNMEDFYGAGCLVDRLAGRSAAWRLTDSALAARDYFRALEPGPVLHGSLVGRLLHQWGLDEEVAFAARIDALPVAAELRGDRVERVWPGGALRNRG